MDRTLTFIVAMCVSLASVALGQIPIPKTRLGYIFNGGSNNAPVSLDLHMGPLCPDSKDAFPVAKQVAMHYGADKLRLTMHMFPLPYHHESFYTAIGAKAVRNLASVSAAYKWFEIIYDNLDKLSNDATMGMTTTQVLGQLADFAEEAGVNRSQFLATIAMPELDTECREAWKYSCSRAVFGTPTFFVNDVQVAADPTWTLADWMQVIDPLLLQEEMKEIVVADNKTCPPGEYMCYWGPGKRKCCHDGEKCIFNDGCRCFGDSCEEEEKPNKTCPNGEKECHYLPGKMECCHDDENCIPNAGCRCFGDSCEEEEPNKACPTGTTLCKYLPGKEECCPVSENCIPNVGCRCFVDGEPCASLDLLKYAPEIEEEPVVKPLV